MHPVVIIRHPKERLSKCSLQPLRGREGLSFHKATGTFRYDASGCLLLRVGAPVLSPDDATDPATGAKRPLILLDSTWRLLPQLEACLEHRQAARFRGLPPGLASAYPRRSKIAEDPAGGLASVEALYVALRLLGEDEPSLLEGYRWREAFLAGLSL
jgi:pre-rRNA-processing protein TSR3